MASGRPQGARVATSNFSLALFRPSRAPGLPVHIPLCHRQVLQSRCSQKTIHTNARNGTAKVEVTPRALGGVRILSAPCSADAEDSTPPCVHHDGLPGGTRGPEAGHDGGDGVRGSAEGPGAPLPPPESSLTWLPFARAPGCIKSVEQSAFTLENTKLHFMELSSSVAENTASWIHL